MMIPVYHHFPLVMDNTQITAFKSCPVKWFYNHCLHMGGESSVHLHFGGAYAHGLEITRRAFYKDSKSEMDSIALGVEAITDFWGDSWQFEDEVKNLQQCLGLLELNFMQFPMATDSYMPVTILDEKGEASSAVEFDFMEPLDVMHPYLESPVFFTGRADMLTNSPMYKKGSVLVFDDKTTGGYITPFLRKSWQTRSQFSAYCWGLRKAGYDARGAVVALASITKTKVEFERIETARSVYQIDNWYRSMMSTLRAMKEYYEQMVKDKRADRTKTVPALSPTGNHSDACLAYYRQCWYTEACVTPSGERMKLAGGEQNIWMPHEQRRENLQVHMKALDLDFDKQFWDEVPESEEIVIF